MGEQFGRLSIEHFKSLRAGDSILLSRIGAEPKIFLWIHDSVRRDLIWGEIKLRNAKPLPLDAYMFNAGDFISFSKGTRLPTPPGQHAQPFPDKFELKIEIVYGYSSHPLAVKTDRTFEDIYDGLENISSLERRRLQQMIIELESGGYRCELPLGESLTDYWHFALAGNLEFYLKRPPLGARIWIKKFAGKHILARSHWAFCAHDMSCRSADFLAPFSQLQVGSTLIEQLEGISSLEELISSVRRCISHIEERNH